MKFKTPDPKPDPELEALYKLVDAFADEMKKRLLMHKTQGKFGWDDQKWTPDQIRMEIVNKVAGGRGPTFDPIGVANFCAFLWNRLP